MSGAVVLDEAYMENAARLRAAEFALELQQRQAAAMGRAFAHMYVTDEPGQVLEVDRRGRIKHAPARDARSRYLAGDIDVAEFERLLERELAA